MVRLEDCFTVVWISLALLFTTGSTLKSMRTRSRRIERSNEYKIKQQILRNYDRTTRPVKDDRTTINVNVAISLYHILDTNEREQTFTCQLAIRQRWRDEYLVWNASLFGNVSTVRVPSNKIWTPDLVISNSAGDKFSDYMITNSIISSDGNVLWLFPALIKTYCMLDVKYFPFDTQRCKIIFISWTHGGDQLDITYNSSFENTVYYIDDNQEWLVEGINTKRNVRYYACCEEPYPDVTFTIVMKRGSLFYIINLIAPCFLIFMVSFLGFFLPVESGEKVNLETTILLALVVFLLMVGETMPPTPDSIPILGMFFGLTMVMVTIALVMAVISTNIYAKKDQPDRCNPWIVKVAARFYPDHLPDRSYSIRRRFKTQDCRINGRGEILSITDMELDSLTCNCCQHCAKSDNDLPMPRFHHREDFDHELSEAEWRMVAKFTDRVFFWGFFVISLCTQVALFIHMVPETRPGEPVPAVDD